MTTVRWSSPLLPLAVVGALGACGGRQGDLLVRDGVELARAGKVDEARARFKKALAVSPSTPGARTGLAFLAKDPKRVREHLDAELGAHPTLAQARFSRARALVLTGGPDEAKLALEDLAPLPDDPEVLRLRELAGYLAGTRAEVPAGLEELGISHAALVAAWPTYLAATGSEDVPEAVLARAPRLRASLAARAGRWEEALAALPVTTETALDRATCLAWLDRLDEARALVAEALRVNPGDARAMTLAAALE